MIPVYMSHRIYTKKRLEPGATDNALKYWSINVVLFITDMAESLILSWYPDVDISLYCIWLLVKACGFVVLFLSNFHFASVLYDTIVPKVLPPIEPFIDWVIAQAQLGVAHFFTNITPAIVQGLGGQVKNLLFCLGAMAVSKLEFKAAPTEPQRPVLQPQGNRLAMSFVQEKTENLLGETRPVDANTTQAAIRIQESTNDVRMSERVNIKEGTTI